jgi:hypothetical protein
VILVAAVGAVWALFRDPRLRLPAAVYAAFWLAQLYNVILIYAAKGVPTSMGWYLYAVVGAEVVLCTAGLRVFLGGWAAAPGVVLFALLDLYATHFVAIPYYAGLIRHKPNGALEAFHIGSLRALPHLLPWLVALWTLYLAATGAALWLGCAPLHKSRGLPKGE